MTGITFLNRYDDDRPFDGVIRAGGTDLQERLRTRNESPRIVDLTGVEAFTGIDRRVDATRIGAGTTVAAVAAELMADYPGLAKTAAGLATPQIRAVATVGGNLLQRTRCWYFRHPDLACFKNGGDSCPARTGRHLYGVVFDRSDCVHPHPSSLAMALLTYDARITTADGRAMSVAALLGDGVDPRRDNQLEDQAMLTSIVLKPAWDGERASYHRAISRFEAEWPLVEAVCRVRLDASGAVAQCGLAVGGVATVPLRMTAAEERLRGTMIDDATIAEVAALCTTGADPLPETGYKVDLIEATVTQVLQDLLAT